MGLKKIPSAATPRFSIQRKLLSAKHLRLVRSRCQGAYPTFGVLRTDGTRETPCLSDQFRPSPASDARPSARTLRLPSAEESIERFCKKNDASSRPEECDSRQRSRLISQPKLSLPQIFGHAETSLSKIFRIAETWRNRIFIQLQY